MKKRLTKKRFAILSWLLLEAKIRYYLYPHMDNICDAEYDRLEKIYVDYCEKNDVPNTIQSMVGIDQTRPSTQIAMLRVSRNSLLDSSQF